MAGKKIKNMESKITFSPQVNIRSCKRRDSISSQSPQHNPMSPMSPVIPAVAPATTFKSPSPPLHPLPERQPLENTQAEVTTAKGTCLGRARVRRREQETAVAKPAKQSRRGRPRGSGGVKRKAKAEPPAISKKLLEAPLFETDEGQLTCLPAMDTDPLEWMEGSPSMFFNSSTSIFELQLEEENGGLYFLNYTVVNLNGSDQDKYCQGVPVIRVQKVPLISKYFAFAQYIRIVILFFI